MNNLSAAEVIRLLALKPHPEGGHYAETFRDGRQIEGRSASTAIYYLLDTGDVSQWHRIDAVETWHWHAGAPLVLTVSPDGHDASAHHLGNDLKAGQRPQFIVPTGWFDFGGFELAPPDWRPTPRRS